MRYLRRFRCGLFGALFLCLAACGKADKELPIPVILDEPVVASMEEPHLIAVYVCGAVRDPRVVELPEGSRVQDAMDAAGGMTSDADRDAVNLAELVYDGQKLYFPTEGEEDILGQTAAEQTKKVNINTADAAALCTLPGIGPSRAEAILADRRQNGPFDTVTDIMRVSGIKEGAFEKIKDLITVR